MRKSWILLPILAVAIGCQKKPVAKPNIIIEEPEPNLTKPKHEEPLANTPASQLAPSSMHGSPELGDSETKKAVQEILANPDPIPSHDSHSQASAPKTDLYEKNAGHGSNSMAQHRTESKRSGKLPAGEAAKMFEMGNDASKARRHNEANEYFLTSCQLGYLAACHRYGWMLQGTGNLTNALKFYARACETGMGKSCNNIGQIYESRKDLEMARNYYSWSCIRKHALGCENLKRVQQFSLSSIPLKKVGDAPSPQFAH